MPPKRSKNMKKPLVVLFLALLSTSPVALVMDTAFAAESVAAASPPAGKMLFSAGGKRLAPVYRVAPDGAPQVMLDGRLITVPVATLSVVNGKVETSLSKRELLASR
jgi:hypothetical protein